jgi:hypothetical protein
MHGVRRHSARGRCHRYAAAALETVEQQNVDLIEARILAVCSRNAGVSAIGLTVGF